MLDVDSSRAVKWEYGFDWLDRLVTVKRAEAADVGSLPATTLQREYVFDESDNRTFFDDHVNGVTYHYKYKSIDDNGTTRWSDQLEEILIYDSAAGHRTVGNFVSFETFLHDADGNMTKRTLASTSEEIDYTWTEFDRLEQVDSSANGRMQVNRYDTDGLRERKLDKNGNSSVEFGVGISTSASAPGSSTSTAPSISYISGHMLMGCEIDGEFRYHLTDALSTVRDVVDDTGAVIRSFEFSEYGDLISSSGSGAASPKTWIGGLSVNDDTADSGMFNMGHRNYASNGGVLGRFISRDPIGHAGNLNLYAYPTNPVGFVDPEGLEVTAVLDISTGTMTVTSTEGDSVVYKGIFSGDGDCKNDPSKGHVPFKGPTPPGTYNLGYPVSAQATHPDNSGDLMWIPIINRATGNDRVFVTDPKTGRRVERNAMFVHPGSVSQGCVTFPNESKETGELRSSDFSELKEMLMKTRPFLGPNGTTRGGVRTYPGTLIVK
ncbi:MAG: RHS repeat-associated core domain-containing protein [Vulcanimicrobiota bacterium]